MVVRRHELLLVGELKSSDANERPFPSIDDRHLLLENHSFLAVMISVVTRFQTLKRFHVGDLLEVRIEVINERVDQTRNIVLKVNREWENVCKNRLPIE